MDRLAQWWMEGGWGMYPILLLGLFGVPAALALVPVGLLSKRAKPAVICAAILLGIGALALVLGIAVERYSTGQVLDAVAGGNVHPADRDTIVHAGLAEALTPLMFGLWVAVLPLAGGALLAMRARALRRGLGTGVWPGVLAAILVMVLGGVALSSVSTAKSEHEEASLRAPERPVEE